MKTYEITILSLVALHYIQYVYYNRTYNTLYYHAINPPRGPPYQVEVYDILFVRELNNAHIVECVHCARKFTSSPGFKGYTVLAEHPLSVLTDAYRTFIDDLPPSTSTPTTTLATTTTTTTTTLDVKS